MTITYGPRCQVHTDRIGPLKTLGANRLFVLHTSEGGESTHAAEDLCVFLQQPGDRPSPSGVGMYGASYHYLLDTDRVLPAVREDRVAFAAAGANADGVHACFPGRAGQTRAQWLDPTSLAMVGQCAALMLDRMPPLGIPLRRLDYLAVRSGAWGYCDHYAVNQAYGLTAHTDCGPNFPWDVLGGMLIPHPPQEAPPMATLPNPVRVLDTDRQGGRLQAQTPRRVGVLPPPADWARAARVNLTVADPSGQGWLSTDRGATVKVNFEAGQEVSNEVSVPVAQDAVGGWGFEVLATQGCRLVVDLVGWDSVL